MSHNHDTTPPKKEISQHIPKKIPLPPSSKKTKSYFKLIAFFVIASTIALYGMSFNRLQSTEKFTYINELDGSLIQKNITKFSFIHDFLWKEKKIMEGFPLKAQSIQDFSPIVKEKNSEKKLESSLSDFWNNTKSMQVNSKIYPEKIIFSLTHNKSADRLFQRMTYWDENGSSYSAEINERYGHVITENPKESSALPSKITELPIDRIILNISETSLRIPGLKHIILEYKSQNNTYDATFINNREQAQKFYVNQRGLILQK
jgi:hypothetical protein